MDIIEDYSHLGEFDLTLAVDQGNYQSTTMFGSLVETWLCGSIDSWWGQGFKPYIAASNDPRIELARLLRKTADVRAKREQSDQQMVARQALRRTTTTTTTTR